MKYNLAALAATPIFLLVSADNIPSGSKHDPSWGNAVVENACDQPVYYVYDNHRDRSTIAPSATMSVPLYTKAADDGGGSIKLFTDKDADLYSEPLRALTQFEFAPTTQQYFDISNVNSNIGDGKNGNGKPCKELPPFMNSGMKLLAPGLKDVSCEPGVNPCKTVYSKYNDDFATAATDIGADIKLVLCPQGGSSLESGGQDGKGGQGNKGGYGNKEGEDDQEEEPPAPESSLQQSSTEQRQPSQTSQSPTTKEKDVVEPQESSPPSQPSPQQKQQQQEPGSEEGQSEDDIVWVTQVVTAAPHVETLRMGSDGQPVKDGGHYKRHDHIHQHVHNKINKRRHGA
ncbi:MAG: hypothetical protein Q9217_006512 [Psora testacea]